MRNCVTSPTCGSETVLKTCAASGPPSSHLSVSRSALPHFCASTGGRSCGAGHNSTSLLSNARVPYVSSAAPQNNGKSSPFAMPAFIAATDDTLLERYLGGERSEEHTSELQSRLHLLFRLLPAKKNNKL